MMAGAHWFVARTAPKQERVAQIALRAEQIESYLPLLPKVLRRGEITAAPLFPNFLFVQLDTASQGWTRVFSTRGVRSVLGMNDRPSPLQGPIVDQIRVREAEAFLAQGMEAPCARIFKAGEMVRFTKGPFATLDAAFIEPIDNRRCQVLIRLLGVPRIAQAELAHIE